MKKYSRVTGALCGALFISNLFAAKIKNEDLYYQRLWPVVYPKNDIQKEQKKVVKKIDPLQTRLIKYNNTGDIFVHMHDTGDDWKTVINIYNIDKHLIVWTMSEPPYKDCILNQGQHSDYAAINSSFRKGIFVDWNNLYEHNSTINLNRSRYDNSLQTVAFSPSGNSLLSRYKEHTWVYNKETKQEYKWTRSGGRHAAFLNENYMVSIGENDSMVPVYSIEKEPKTEFLPQGEIYTAQQAVLSPDEKMFAIASSYEDKKKNRAFTQIILYDATTLKEIRKLYIPGVLYSGLREEQHENIFFSPDNKRLFMHTLTTTEGINSWYVDVTSNSDYVRIKHSPFIKKLYELAGEYNFGGTEPRKVSIFDIRNPNRALDLNVENPSHLAVNPNKDSKIKAVIALADTTKLLYYTGSSNLLKDEEEKRKRYKPLPL